MSTNKEDDQYVRIVYVSDEDDWTNDPITLPGFMAACMVTIIPMFVLALGAVIMWSKYYG